MFRYITGVFPHANNMYHTRLKCPLIYFQLYFIFQLYFFRAASNSLQGKDKTTTGDKLIVFIDEKLSRAVDHGSMITVPRSAAENVLLAREPH